MLFTFKSYAPKSTAPVAPVYGTPPEDGVLQLKVPEPSVFKTWFAVPSVLGIVMAPAVIVPLVFTLVIDVFPN